MVIRRLILTVAVAAASLAPGCMAAQVHQGPGMHPVEAGRGAASPFTISLGAEPKVGNLPAGKFLLAPFFYPLYDYEPARLILVRESPPQPSASAPSLREEPKSISPLLIERQGNRFVRMTDSEYHNLNGSRAPVAEAENPRNLRGERVRAPGAAWRATMLVFRDGHQEQASNYTIVGGTLYKHSDYWIDASSTTKISIAELDIEATVRANQARGVKFVLPRAPNEVVTRP